MSFQAYLDKVEELTGQTPQEFIALAKQKQLTEHKDLIAWLKTDYGLGLGHARAIAYVIQHGPDFTVRQTTGPHRDASGTLQLAGKSAVKKTTPARRASSRAKRGSAPAELKTKETSASVATFLSTVQDEGVRRDCAAIVKLMKQVSRADPKLWGTSIIGFGKRRLKYASGRELDWMLLGFSPRKGKITLYLPGGLEQQRPLLQKLGKHTTGKGCLYFKQLADVDPKVLKELLSQSLRAAADSSS